MGNSEARLASSLALIAALVVGTGCVPPNKAPVVPASADVEQLAPGPGATPPPILDEHFQRAWPNDPQGMAWFGGSGYTLFARQPTQFVAIRAPIADVPTDVSVIGTFHKVGGPPGGGYGLIVRDQTIGAGDGQDQNGRFLVAAVGDRGLIGIWQRADSRWIDLVPWTESALVRPGTASNVLKVDVVGDRLRFEVNGARVADVEVGFPSGSIGVFVGGDLNQVQLDRLLVEKVQTSTGGSVAATGPAPAQNVPAARTRLTTLAARATQDSTVMQDPGWRQEMAATLAVLEQIAGAAPATTPTTPSTRDSQRLRQLLGGITDELASILDAFASGVENPRNPLNSPRALDQAAQHLNSAVGQANQVLADVESARRSNDGAAPAR